MQDPAYLSYVITLLASIVSTALFSSPVVAGNDTVSDTTAPVNTMLIENARQATLTVSGKSSVHYYESEFVLSPIPTTNGQATKNVDVNQSAINTATPDRQVASYNPLLWIFDISLHLNTDRDHDGHYSNFSLTLDLDTSFSATTVYAVLYLAREGGPWNEYAVTGNFTISGSGPGDTFSLNAELDSGYPSGYYNHYIEVYDAYTHELIGSYGPNDSHQLFGLPIESRLHDDGITFGTDISLSFSGTGSTAPGLWSVAIIGLLIRRRFRVKPQASGSHHVPAR